MLLPWFGGLPRSSNLPARLRIAVRRVQWSSSISRPMSGRWKQVFRPRGPAIRVDADASGVDGASGATRKGDSRVDCDGSRADEGHVALPVLNADAFKVENSRLSVEEWLGRKNGQMLGTLAGRRLLKATQCDARCAQRRRRGRERRLAYAARHAFRATRPSPPDGRASVRGAPPLHGRHPARGRARV